MEKPLDEGTWSAGYKVELWFGPNAQGVGNDILGDNGLGVSNPGNDVAVKQAYVALRIPVQNGIDVKMGAFDTIIGYEVANAGSNPNYTRSYAYSIEPTEHTGIMASYQFNKMFGVSAGVVNTWSAGINARNARGSVIPDNGTRSTLESDKGYMAAVTFTAPDSWGFLAGSTVGAGIVDGYAGLVGNDVTSYYVGGTFNTPWKFLKVGASYDYAASHDNGIGPSAHAQAAGLYTSITPEDTKFSFHIRAEYFDISSAYATGGKFNAGDPTKSGLGSVGGVPDDAFALTGTIQYDLWANVLTRLEIRWDHVTKGHPAFGGNATPGKKDEALIAANVIYKF